MNVAIRHPAWRYRLLINLFLGIVAFASAANAHESRPAYLEIDETAPGRCDVIWRTPLNAGMRLPIGLKFSEDVSNVTAPAVRELPDSIVERRIIKVTEGSRREADRFCRIASNHHRCARPGAAARRERIDYSCAAFESMGGNHRLARPHRCSQQLRIARDRAHCLWHRSSAVRARVAYSG